MDRKTAEGRRRGESATAQGFARKLEGYDAADLRALVERTLHAALMRRLASRPRPTGASPLFEAFVCCRMAGCARSAST